MDKEIKKELRKLLTGRTIRNENGWLEAVPDGSRLVYFGASDNMGRRIITRSQTIVLEGEVDKVFRRILKALQETGLLVNMLTRPDALCALRRYGLTKAVIICVTPVEENGICIQAHTGKSLLAGFFCRNALNKVKAKILDHN